MAVDLGRVQQQAPGLYSLVKEAEYSLKKSDLDPAKYKAAVIATADHSSSTEFAHRLLYTRGVMQKTIDIVFAAGLLFDDDGEIPLSLFSDHVQELGDMNLDNCQGFLDQHRRYPFGSTDYVSALRWIVKTAGYGHLDRGHTVSAQPQPRKHSWFSSWSRDAQASNPSGLQLLATAQYPTYACFVTDGEPNPGTEDAIRAYLTWMSQLPIFVQFVGVGDADFAFLRELDEMDGRFVDNANFFDAKEVGHDQSRMLERMLGEFPDYYKKAIDLGLVAPTTS